MDMTCQPPHSSVGRSANAMKPQQTVESLNEGTGLMRDYLGMLCCNFSVLIVLQVLPSRQSGSQFWMCIRSTWKCFRTF